MLNTVNSAHTKKQMLLQQHESVIQYIHHLAELKALIKQQPEERSAHLKPSLYGLPEAYGKKIVCVLHNNVS